LIVLAFLGFDVLLQALQRGYEKALAMELKHIREKKYVFKKARGLEGGKLTGQQQKEKGKKAKVTLSFADQEEEEGGE
jgi:hypothetical protein